MAHALARIGTVTTMTTPESYPRPDLRVVALGGGTGLPAGPGGVKP